MSIPCLFFGMILVTQKVFHRNRASWRRILMPLNSQLYSYFSIFPSSSRFLLPVTSVLLRGDGAAHSVFWVCFHGVSARTKLPKMVISLIGPPSAKCLGKIFKNLENILSPPLGFHLRGNASVKLSRALNLLVVAAAAVPSVPPGPVGGSVYQMASLQQDLAVGQ